MKSIILLFLCSATISLSAQETHTTDKKKKWEEKWEGNMPFMTRGIGISFQKFDGLNSRIAGMPQFETLRDHTWNLSAGTMHVKNNFISEFTISGGSSLSGHRNKKSSALRNLGVGLDFGYDLIPSERVMVYPLVGIGGETYAAVFYRDVSGVNFNDVGNFPTVQNNIRSVKFTNSFFTYRLGLGIAFKSPDGDGSIGLQGGYTGSFKDQEWKSAEYQSLANAPTDKLSRVNVSLILSGRGMMHHMKKK